MVYLVFKALADWFEVSVCTLCMELSFALPLLLSTLPLSFVTLSCVSLFFTILFPLMRFLGDAREAI